MIWETETREDGGEKIPSVRNRSRNLGKDMRSEDYADRDGCTAH